MVNPGGTRTGKLLPTGHAVDTLKLPDGTTIEASMVDAANPCVFVRASDVGKTGTELPDALEGDRAFLDRMEAIRCHLREKGYVVSCGLWSQHINGIAIPIWSPQYQTYAVVTIGVLSAMYDEQRLHDEVAPPLRALARDIEAALSRPDADVFRRAVVAESDRIRRYNDQLGGTQ